MHSLPKRHLFSKVCTPCVRLLHHCAKALTIWGLVLVLGLDQRRYRLDPLYIENPLAPQTNVTRNCFRIYRIQVPSSLNAFL